MKFSGWFFISQKPTTLEKTNTTHMKIVLLVFLLLISFNNIQAQEITGQELLAKTIEFHDPNGHWSAFVSNLKMTETRPNGTDRSSVISINNLTGDFKVEGKSDSLMITRGVKNDSCYVLVNGSASFDEALVKQYRLKCERSTMFKNYYVYLYGLPMKLTDDGTIIDEKVETVDFTGAQYYKLRVTYEKEVGSDIWYFYINPETYAMEAYQFYHDESTGKGEYITLDGMVEIQGIKFPKARKWFTNLEDKHLGTDTIVSGN